MMNESPSQNDFSQRYSQYYDLFYQEKDYQGEAETVVRLIRQHLPAAKTALELGCGTGNHARFLIQHGFAVTGIDRSPEMIRHAEAKGMQGFTGVVADMRHFNLGTRFDAAISLFHVISYLTTDNDLLIAFQQVNAHLNDGGIFCFDTWYTPAVSHQKPQTRMRRWKVDDGEVLRIAEPAASTEANVVAVHYKVIHTEAASLTATKLKEVHLMRHFSVPEMEKLAGQTGFRLLTVKSFPDLLEPGEDTWGVCFILMKVRESHSG